jgi:hypothetical protein
MIANNSGSERIEYIEVGEKGRKKNNCGYLSVGININYLFNGLLFSCPDLLLICRTKHQVKHQVVHKVLFYVP